MIKPLRQAVIAAFKHMMEEYTTYHQYDAKKYAVVYRCQYSENLSGFVELRIVNNRDYVIPNVYWSKLNRLPEESCLNPGHLSQIEDNLSRLDSHEEVMLTRCEFGQPSNALALDHNTPSPEKLATLFASDTGGAHLAQLGFKSWRDATVLHDWDLIEELFPEHIEPSDIHYATANLISSLTETICEQYIPYLNGVAERLS